MEYSVVIVASGLGTRLNLGYNKVFYKLDNEMIIEKTINKFKQDLECKQIIVVTNSEDFHRLENYQVELVNGGKLRQDSVYNGLKLVKYDYVMIHDGARPYVSQNILDRVKKALELHNAVVTTVASVDTIKLLKDDKVITLDRNTLRNAQTPQAFKTEILLEAYAKASNKVYTDDTSIVEEVLKLDIYNVEGEYENIKITTINDIK